MEKRQKRMKNVFVVFAAVTLWLGLWVAAPIVLSRYVFNENASGEDDAKRDDVRAGKSVDLIADVPDDDKSDIEEPTPTPTPTPAPLPPTNVKPPPPKVTPPPAPKPPPPPPPSTNGCPQSTLNCVPCNAGEPYCRTEPGETTGYKGWSCQNNNPGNIRNASTDMSTDFKNLMIVRNGGAAACGVRYDSRGGSYFIFRTYTEGKGALKAYIKGVNNGEHSAYTGCGNCTLSFFFSKYAPGDPNYDDAVAGRMGISTSTTLNWVVQNKLDQFVNEIQTQEGFYTQ